MSTEPTDAFPEIDPDPDAVLAAFGIDSPDELAAAGGAHDPTRDDQLDADDTTAADLFANLQDADPEPQPVAAADGGDPSSSDDADESTAQADDDLEFEFIGDAAVTVRDDGDVIDETAADLRALTATATAAATDAEPDRSAQTGPDTDTTADLDLVGPEPTPTRVANERFNSASADGR
ncbi:hypothetical protein [Natronorubrum bangense]|uniref:Uncharacterized protein n=2 Tax=Natronorubrum bangense TaxID=61858 RepID=L9WM48_9EURY|nr:hypothetical protein [Natronorubrum bangense]ELY50311.1 hypothetical protein C494_05878 [Natronorubrum bangense JCM 10635]QCC54248.1 hypothetical protein DV706_06950 [Natronorubrum bangense]